MKDYDKQLSLESAGKWGRLCTNYANKRAANRSVDWWRNNFTQAVEGQATDTFVCKGGKAISKRQSSRTSNGLGARTNMF